MSRIIPTLALWGVASGWAISCDARTASPVAQHGAPEDQSSRDASSAEVTALARMLRARTDLSWLLSAEELERMTPSPEEKAEARTIVQLARVSRARGLEHGDAARAALRTLETALLAEVARRDMMNSIEVNDRDVATALATRRGRYDEYRLSHIFVAAGDLPDGGKRSDDEAKAKAERLAARITAGEDFTAIAKSDSDDPSTAELGGELSSMFGMYMASEFFPVVQQLRAGQTSGPVRGRLGYHILRLDEHFPATPTTARFMITQDIRDERMPRLVADAIRELRQ